MPHLDPQQINKIKAETKFSVATFEGDAKKALAQAELEANKYLLKMRQFELRDKHLDTYEALAKNKEVVLSDSSAADFNMLLLADNVLASSKAGGAGAQGHSKLLAELNMLRLASSAYGLQQTTYFPDGKAELGPAAAARPGL